MKYLNFFSVHNIHLVEHQLKICWLSQIFHISLETPLKRTKMTEKCHFGSSVDFGTEDEMVLFQFFLSGKQGMFSSPKFLDTAKNN